MSPQHQRRPQDDERPPTRVFRRDQPPSPPEPEPEDDLPEQTDNPFDDVMRTLLILIEKVKQGSREHMAMFEDLRVLLQDSAVLKDRVGIRDGEQEKPAQPGVPATANIVINPGGQSSEKKTEEKRIVDQFISPQLVKWIAILVFGLVLLVFVADRYGTNISAQHGNTSVNINHPQPKDAPKGVPGTTTVP